MPDQRHKQHMYCSAAKADHGGAEDRLGAGAAPALKLGVISTYCSCISHGPSKQCKAKGRQSMHSFIFFFLFLSSQFFTYLHYKQRNASVIHQNSAVTHDLVSSTRIRGGERKHGRGKKKRTRGGGGGRGDLALVFQSLPSARTSARQKLRRTGYVPAPPHLHTSTHIRRYGNPGILRRMSWMEGKSVR